MLIYAGRIDGFTAALSAWLRTLDAPICKLSPNRTEKRFQPYSAEEIRAMREAMKRFSWQCYIRWYFARIASQEMPVT